MKNQAFRMTMLYDFYGDVLTKRQQEFYDLYYNEDLSLAEIAENYGITRQGVRDVIVRAEATLTDLEDKTGLIKRFQQIQPLIKTILSSADSLSALNEEKYNDPELEALVGQIRAAAADIRED